MGITYGSSNFVHHESVRSGRCKPPHDLQLDCGRKSGVRADGRRIDPYFRRYALAGRESASQYRVRRHRQHIGTRVILASRPEDSGEGEPRSLTEMSRLFHKLNNQLGIVLAHAEMLEEKVTDPTHREHAARVVSSVLSALETSREIRRLSDTANT